MPIVSGYDYNLRYSDGAKDVLDRSISVGEEWSGGISGHIGRHDVVPDSNANNNMSAAQGSSEIFIPDDSRLEIIERIKRSNRPQHWPAHGQDQQDQAEVQDALASSIERPRSALHKGDFHGDSFSQNSPGQTSPVRSTCHEHSWLGTSPPAPWRSQLPHRARAASHSLRFAFVFRAPTSPLANLSNSADLDVLEQHAGRVRGTVSDKSSRRHTFSPSALNELRQSPPSPYLTDPFDDLDTDAGFRRGSNFPYQAHQPRRSLASFDDAISSTSARISSAHMRRPSLTSETSPQQRLPMVGRYEESILRGRMSSLPSRPLDFVAQIGVLGKGNCKSSLKCPAHITIPFPAIFYHYGNLPGASSSDGPSPYVGLIDLEKSIQATRDASTHFNQQLSRNARVSAEDSDMIDPDQNLLQAPQGMRPRSGRPRSHKDGPSGSYRIPEQGQVQVIIRNPNKTAVKLFLVPYDLKSMEPGQKTFIRQRSYTAGPILDMPLDARRNLGTDRPEAALSNSDDPRERPVLRYLIHLHICCTARGRYYLYKNIRIVFANRVPDGKEKLRQEIQLPEPRFSPYKAESLGNVLETLAHRTKSEASRTDSAQMFSNVVPIAREAGTRPRQDAGWDCYAREDHASLSAGFMTNSIEQPNISRTCTVNTSIHDEVVIPRPINGKARSQQLSACEVDASLRFSPSLFGKLGRSEWTPSGTPPRTYSLQPGEGLIAQQYRSWAEGNNSSDAYPA